jgi:hypothetical protein
MMDSSYLWSLQLTPVTHQLQDGAYGGSPAAEPNAHDASLTTGRRGGLHDLWIRGPHPYRQNHLAPNLLSVVAPPSFRFRSVDNVEQSHRSLMGCQKAIASFSPRKNGNCRDDNRDFPLRISRRGNVKHAADLHVQQIERVGQAPNARTSPAGSGRRRIRVAKKSFRSKPDRSPPRWVGRKNCPARTLSVSSL